MKPLKLALLGASALGVTACGGPGDTGNSVTEPAAGGMALNTTETAPPATPDPGQAFANKAAASDAFEIATSQLALEKAQSAEIKKFASHMIEAHTESTSKLKAAAAASPGVTPEPALTAEQQSKLESLRSLSGVEFDIAYIAEQRAAHEMTLAALQDYAAKGDVAALKAFAAEMVPVVAEHVKMANSLKA